MMKMKIG